MRIVSEYRVVRIVIDDEVLGMIVLVYLCNLFTLSNCGLDDKDQ